MNTHHAQKQTHFTLRNMEKPYDLDVLNVTKYTGQMSRERCVEKQHSNFGISGIRGISGRGSWYIRHINKIKRILSINNMIS